MNDRPTFWMQKQPIDGVEQEKINVELRFNGLKYVECKGLEDRGKIKNKYIETYSDSDELRIWEDDIITRNATTITFKFYVVGDRRRQVFDDFYNYIKQGKISYYDTARKKQALIVLMDEIKPSADKLYGSTPYIEFSATFQNLWGECKDVNI